MNVATLQADGRFWRNVAESKGGCWRWLGAVVDGTNQRGGRAIYDGFALVVWTDRPQLAIRYALDLIGRAHTGRKLTPTPACRETKLCVNPWHWAIEGAELSQEQLSSWAVIKEVTQADFRPASNLRPKEQIAVFLARKLIHPRISLPQLGYLCGRNHATMLYTERLIGQRGAAYWAKYEREVLERLGGGLDGTGVQSERAAA